MSEITIVLHNIRSTHNVGSILRTAEGLGITTVVCSGYTPYPKKIDDNRLPHIAEKLTTQIHKTALGAESMLNIQQFDDIYDWIKTRHTPIVALEQSPNSIDLALYTPPEEFSLLLGEEVNGIHPDIMTIASAIVEIPMLGKKESFNVSVAAGIALYVLSGMK